MSLAKCHYPQTQKEHFLVVTLHAKASEIRPCVSLYFPELSEINHIVLTGIRPLTPAISELLFLPLELSGVFRPLVELCVEPAGLSG